MLKKCIPAIFTFLMLAGLFSAWPVPFLPVQAASQPAAASVVQVFTRGSGPLQVGISPADRQPFGPQAIQVDEKGQLYLLDSLNNRVFAFQPGQAAAEAMALSGVQMPGDLVVQAGSLYVLDLQANQIARLSASGQALASYPTSGPAQGSRITVLSDGTAAPESAAPFTSLSSSSTRQAVQPSNWHSFSSPLSGLVYYQSQRLTDSTGQLLIARPDGRLLGKLPLGVDHYLGTARLLQVDRAGNYYLLVEELLKDVPVFVVDATIRRYTPDGQLTGVARVPVAEQYAMPQRAAAVSLDGAAYGLLVQADQAQVLALPFVTGYQSDLESRWQAAQPKLAAQLKQAAQPNLAPQALQAGQPGPQAPVNQLSVTRSQVIATAKGYLSANWYLNDANYYKGPTNDWSGCLESPPWRLPRYLANRLHQTIAEVPYAWGGYQSVDEFKTRINNGNWAGDICSEAILSNVAGVDCSGFVSKVIGLGHYTVNGLIGVTYGINWNDLKAGDILPNSGSHVRLFEKFANNSDISGGVIELEANGGGYDRVVYLQLSFSDLNNYSARRSNNVVDDYNPMPANTNVIVNGDFSANLNGWWTYGDVDYAFYGSTLYFKRRVSANSGAVLQSFGYTVSPSSPLEMVLQLGNASNVTKSPKVVILKNGDPTNITCQFTIPPNTPLQTYIVRGRSGGQWDGFNIEVWPDPPDGIPDVMMDNVSLQYKPDLNISGTECIPPDTTAPTGEVTAPANQSTITGPGNVAFTANASDNGGSGVKTVEFHVYYDGVFHQVGTDDTAPYGVQWAVPAGLASQQLMFTIHVIDNAGNEVMDPGGYHYVNYQAFAACTTCGLADSAWPMHRGNLKRTGQSALTGPQYPQLNWTYSGSDYASAPAIGPDGTVYTALGNIFFALNPNGSAKWSYPTSGNFSGWSPAVTADGKILVGHSDGTIYAFRANGTIAWTYPTGGWIAGSPAVTADGTIYIGTSMDKLIALNHDGSLKWEMTGGIWDHDPSVGPDGTVYFGGTDQAIWAVNPNGTQKWRYQAGGYVDTAPVVGTDGNVYAGSADGYLYALRASDGALAWRYLTPGSLSYSAALANDGTLYIASEDRDPADGFEDANLYALTSTGGLKWSMNFGENISCSPTVGSDGVVYLSVNNSHLYAINPNGTQKWNIRLDDGNRWLQINPVIGPNNVVYVTSRWPAKIYAVGPANSQPAPSLTSLNPSSVPAGSAQFTLTVTGANFTTNSVVRWNTTALNTAFINDTYLTATVPASLVANAGAATITVYTPPPGGGTSNGQSFTISAGADYGITINAGALFTNQVAVTLSISARPGTTQMQVSNDGGFLNASWEPFAASKPWTITQYGSYVIPRFVYIRFKDGSGNVSGLYLDDIVLDITAPGGSIRLAEGSSRTPGAKVSLNLSASDDTSGVSKMIISNDPNFTGASWEPYATSRTWTLDTSTKVYARFQDNAGNVSPVYATTGFRILLPRVVK